MVGWYLDGRVSGVLGTHLRTPTADARLLKQGTAHVTDVGLVGLYDSAAGLEVETALKPFVNHVQGRSKPNRKVVGPVAFNSVLVEIELATKQAISVQRYDLILDSSTMSGFA